MSTITNIALSDIPTVVTIDENFDILNTDKLEVGNLIQGDNITFEINGNDITISAIGGTDGKNIEMRYDSTYLQYRLVGDLNWINLVQIESTIELSNRIGTLETNQGDLSTVPTELQNKTIAEMITANFTSGSNWKTTIANAITTKGVNTLATDTLQVFENNIGLISSEDAKTYLYKNGDECVSLTGGWVAGTPVGNVVQSKNTDHLYMKTTGTNFPKAYYFCVNNVDITSFIAIYVEYSVTIGGGENNITVGVFTNKTEAYPSIANGTMINEAITSNKKMIANIMTVTGLRQLGIRTYSNGSTTTFEVKIHKVWLQ